MLAMVPMVQGVYLPFAFETVDDVAKAYSGESLAIIEKAMEKKRLKLLYTSYLDPVQLFSNKGNIQGVGDFKGLRIFSSSPIFTENHGQTGCGSGHQRSPDRMVYGPEALCFRFHGPVHCGRVFSKVL